MDYQKIYSAICLRGQIRQIDGYQERHHIVPKCLGGTNALANLTALTLREHFLAHRLLVKINPLEKKLHYALWRMANSKKHKHITMRQYEAIRTAHIETLKGNQLRKGIAPWNKGLLLKQKKEKIYKGYKWCEDRKTKFSQKMLGNTIWIGRQHSNVTKLLMREKALAVWAKRKECV